MTIAYNGILNLNGSTNMIYLPDGGTVEFVFSNISNKGASVNYYAEYADYDGASYRIPKTLVGTSDFGLLDEGVTFATKTITLAYKCLVYAEFVSNGEIDPL